MFFRIPFFVIGALPALVLLLVLALLFSELFTTLFNTRNYFA
jgi:hypothetical protein